MYDIRDSFLPALTNLAILLGIGLVLAAIAFGCWWLVTETPEQRVARQLAFTEPCLKAEFTGRQCAFLYGMSEIARANTADAATAQNLSNLAIGLSVGGSRR